MSGPPSRSDMLRPGSKTSTSNNNPTKPVSFQQPIEEQNKPPSIQDVNRRDKNSMPTPVGYVDTHSTSEPSLVQDVEKMNIETIEEAGTTQPKPTPVGYVAQVENKEDEPLKEAEPVQEDETSLDEPMSGPPISTGRWRPRFPKRAKYDAHSTSEPSLVQDVEKMNLETIEESGTTPAMPTLVGDVAQVEKKEDEPLKEAEPVQEDETSPAKPMSGPPISTSRWRPRFPRVLASFLGGISIRTRSSSQDEIQVSTDMVIKEVETPFDMPTSIQDVEESNIETDKEAGTTSAKPTSAGDVTHKE